ncbi:WXG100 family type VII secretion target [Nocardia sp. X0981]
MRELPRVGKRGVHDRFDPDYAPTVEVFDNLTHQQIHAGVSLLNPAVLQAGSLAWQGAAAGLSDAVAQAHTEIRGAIADGWRGDAAGLAAAAVGDFEAAGRQLADVLAAVGQRLNQASDAAETLRAGVPEPSGAEPDLTAALLNPRAATDNIATQRAVDDDRADAVRVMESVYTGTFVPTGARVPAFPELPVAEAGTDGPAPMPLASAASETAAGRTVAAPVPVPAPVPGSEQPADPAAGTDPAVSEAPVTGTAGAVADRPPAGPVPQSTTAAATGQPVAAAPVAAPPPGSAPAAPPVTSAASVNAPPIAVPVRPAATGTDDERKREERRRDSSGEAITGMGAGAIGGMMGGAMAADTVRSGSPVAAPARTERTETEEDELHFTDEELTFLEPGEVGGQLVGTLDPTTPPVLGEWTEEE